MPSNTTDTLVRAARELLRWDQKLLAKRSGVSIATIRRFETGIDVSAESVDAIVKALQKAGVAFLGPDRPAAPIAEGVALTSVAKPRRRPKTRVYSKSDPEPSS